MGQGCRFKLTLQLLQILQVSGIIGAQVYYSGMVQVDGSKNGSLEQHHFVCNRISQFFTIHAAEVQLRAEDAADGSMRKRSHPEKKPKARRFHQHTSAWIYIHTCSLHTMLRTDGIVTQWQRR